MRSWRLALIIWVVLPLSGQVPVLSDSSCSIRLHVTDNFGNRIEPRRLQLSQGESLKQVLPDEPVQVTCGHATITALASGFEVASVPIDVTETNQVFNVALRLGALDAPIPTCAISASLDPGLADRWAHVIQIYGTRMLEVSVGQDGILNAKNLTCGTYLLVIIRGKECLGTQMVDATAAGRRIALRMRANSGCNTLGDAPLPAKP